MEASRIFVKNLPPSMGVEDFRKHFSKQAPITDAKFIPHRRIGYVGYKTPQDAARAVKYHNRSFIRTSRIGVELARSVQDQSVLKTAKHGANGIQTQYGDCKDTSNTGYLACDGQRKRKRDTGLNGEGDLKLKEFLDVMQRPSRAKTWENQGADNANAARKEASSDDKKLDIRSESDQEYEPMAKKEKEPPVRQVGVDQTSPDFNMVMLDTNHDKTATIQHNQEECPAIDMIMSVASDADWLRSRTSRLLGLIDDEEAREDAINDATKAPVREAISPSLPRTHEALRHDANTQTDNEPNSGDNTNHGMTDEALEAIVFETQRLFVRNLAYTTTEEDVRHYFEDQCCGSIEEVHLPIDTRSGHNKGFAHVLYSESESARKALQALDGKPFQGRLLHIMPAKPKKEGGLDDYAISKLPIKKQQQIKRKADAASSSFTWNSLYMNADAVMTSISDRLGVSKSELLDPTSSDAAVKQAHAETHIIQETKAYFIEHGVDLDTFKRKDRGDTAILVKNFPYGTKPDELKSLFNAYGEVTQLLMPPAGIIVIVEFGQSEHARSAFASLAYRKFKDSILFLEKAPKGLFRQSAGSVAVEEDSAFGNQGSKLSGMDLMESKDLEKSIDTSTLFIRNLSFATTTQRLREIFQPLDGFLSARVKTKPDPKRQGQVLSMGFGFLEFRTKDQAEAALKAMDGYELDGHKLLIRVSHKSIDAAEERRKEDHAKKIIGRNTKIVIKNLPFEASKKDVQSLFGSYGKLRSVRVPKKFNSSARGFAFADFLTAKEAENAMAALRNTHLLGRRLVLEFVADDALDPEQEIERMAQKIGKQTNKVTLQSLTGSGRKKFSIEGDDKLDQG